MVFACDLLLWVRKPIFLHTRGKASTLDYTAMGTRAIIHENNSPWVPAFSGNGGLELPDGVVLMSRWWCFIQSGAKMKPDLENCTVEHHAQRSKTFYRYSKHYKWNYTTSILTDSLWSNALDILFLGPFTWHFCSTFKIWFYPSLSSWHSSTKSPLENINIHFGITSCSSWQNRMKL